MIKSGEVREKSVPAAARCLKIQVDGNERFVNNKAAPLVKEVPTGTRCQHAGGSRGRAAPLKVEGERESTDGQVSQSSHEPNLYLLTISGVQTETTLVFYLYPSVRLYTCSKN